MKRLAPTFVTVQLSEQFRILSSSLGILNFSEGFSQWYSPNNDVLFQDFQGFYRYLSLSIFIYLYLYLYLYLFYRYLSIFVESSYLYLSAAPSSSSCVRTTPSDIYLLVTIFSLFLWKFSCLCPSPIFPTSWLAGRVAVVVVLHIN